MYNHKEYSLLSKQEILNTVTRFTIALLIPPLWLFLVTSSVYAEQIGPNPNYGTINVTGNDWNSKDFSNRGQLYVNTGAILSNYDILNSYETSWLLNYGTLNNYSGGTLNLYSGLGNFNTGTVNNYLGGTINDIAHFSANMGGTVNNYGTWTVISYLDNDSGTFCNFNTLINFGVLSNRATATMINSGTLINNQFMNNHEGGLIEGTGRYIQAGGDSPYWVYIYIDKSTK